MTEPIPSLLMTVGREHYRLWEFIEEAKELGVSKRIPATSIPDGMQRLLSKIFCAHPEAIVKITELGRTYQDLAFELFRDGVLDELDLHNIFDLEETWWTAEKLEPYDFVPAFMLSLTVALSKELDQRKVELEKKFGLVYCMGIFGYALFTGFQYVLPKGEEELPSNLEHLTGYVEPVHVLYLDDDEEPVDEDEDGTYNSD